MYISETDLTRRILTGQIEILDDITGELSKRTEKALFAGETKLVECLTEMKIEYSTYRTTLTREKYQITKEGLDKEKLKSIKKKKKSTKGK